ncbi:MAG: two-component sensor histidine kinase [Lachnospiraceae bacterium]|nr:two-component sensor histidine kinase [Lachnospiraceae bacterium]
MRLKFPDIRELFRSIHPVSVIKSLRTRVFVIMFLTGLLSCFAMHFMILRNYEQRAVNVNTTNAQRQLRTVGNHLIRYNYLQDPSSEVVSAELNMISSMNNGRVMIIDETLRIVRDTYGISEGKTIISEEVVRCLKEGTGGQVSAYDPENNYIELTMPIVETASSEEGDILHQSVASAPQEIVRGVILASVSTDTIRNTIDLLSRRAITIELIVILVILLLSLIVSGRLVRPFEKITEGINEIAAGFSDEPLSATQYTETKHIVEAFNQLQRRMHAVDESRDEFVSNVSHELKTPITSMKVLADSLIAQEDVPAEVYRDFMEDIASEVEREDKIINDLLALVKMDKRAARLIVSSVDINQMTENVLKRLRPIARKADVELTLESQRSIVAEIDEIKIYNVIMNLVENAIKYNREHGWVRVTLDADHQYFTVEIADSGVGIPEDALDHVYERFYRVDKSRPREVGGTGLGLSIARSAILMHRGTIQIDSVFGEGPTVTIKLPLTYVTQDNK